MQIDILSGMEPLHVMYKESLDTFASDIHSHNSHEIIFVTDGRAEIDTGSKVYHLKPGSIAFFSSMETHQVNAVSFPYKRYIISIHHDYFHKAVTEPRLISIFKNRPFSFRHIIHLKPPLENETAVLLEDMLLEFDEKDFFYEKVLSDCLFKCLVLLYRNYPGSFPAFSMNESSRIIFSIQKYIEQNYAGTIRLADLSKKHGMNMHYLSRRFKEITGCGFKEYIQMTRISHAKDLLIYSDKDISSISMELGFSSTPHFTASFKQTTGYTPSNYRKSFGNFL